jgi:hypothetical protein
MEERLIGLVRFGSMVTTKNARTKPPFRAALDEAIKSNLPLVGMLRKSTGSGVLRNRANEANSLAGHRPPPPNRANEATFVSGQWSVEDRASSKLNDRTEFRVRSARTNGD